jgi:hypothetical protein
MHLFTTGYGWIIVAASFFCKSLLFIDKFKLQLSLYYTSGNMVVDGIVYSFGIFLPVLAEHYEVEKGTMTWAGSLLSGVYMVVGKSLTRDRLK